MDKLTHFNSAGEAHMVDVGEKAITQRKAVAGGLIRMQAETLRLIKNVKHGKGDVLGVARVAGLMATKKTADLIPLCHTLILSHVAVEMEINEQDSSVACEVTVQSIGQTGVEMEALLGVQIALLTIYDMCKAIDRGMTIEAVGLIEKSGGKSGVWKKNAD